MKLLEYKNEIKTKQIYVNVIVGDEIHTKTLSTEEALKQYSDYAVKNFETPETVDGKVTENGITNIVLEI